MAVVIAVGLAVIGLDRAAPPRQAGDASRDPEHDGGFAWHAPLTGVPPDTPIQHQTTEAFRSVLSRYPGMTEASALTVPAPRIAGGWPELPVEATADGWAHRFVDGLLDIDYARMSRSALGAWLQAHQAPALTPGIPESFSDKMLYASLLATEVFGGQPTPIPSQAEWELYARDGARQRVTDLRVQVNPRWAQIVATGWQPPDLRMTTLDVTGQLTFHRGDVERTSRFGLKLLVGSARWRDGFGSVAVSDWEVEPS
ncbi:MAG TPA: hypothetical protein VFO65_09955 [Acidimicrobiales bacterium]|nr:hypothetical protein [Acidimicrobiales bacterium]